MYCVIPLILLSVEASEILHDSKGIIFREKGEIFTITAVRAISVIHEVIPPQLVKQLEFCGITHNFYEEDVRMITRIMSRSRQRRFLNILGIIGSVVSGGFSLKNMIDVKALGEQVEQLKAIQKQMAYDSQAIVDDIGRVKAKEDEIIRSLSQIRYEIVPMVEHNTCEVQFLRQNFALLVENTLLLKDIKAMIEESITGRLSTRSRQLILPRADLAKIVDETDPVIMHFPGDAIYAIMDFIPVGFNPFNRTAAYVVLIPEIAVQAVATYEVLNVGYVTDIYRMCDLHGMIAMDRTTIFQIHHDICKMVASKYLCPHFALVEDPRAVYLHDDYICPIADGTVLPSVRYDDDLLLVCGTESLFQIDIIEPTARKKTHTIRSKNNVWWRHLDQLSRVQNGHHLIYSIVGVRTSISVANISNIIRLNDTDLIIPEPADLKPIVAPEVIAATTYSMPHIIVIYIWLVVVSVVLILMRYATIIRIRG